jgi:hypothetical protein
MHKPNTKKVAKVRDLATLMAAIETARASRSRRQLHRKRESRHHVSC